MSTQTNPLPPQPAVPVAPKPKSRPSWLATVAIAVVALGAGIGIGAASHSSTPASTSTGGQTVTVPGPTVTVTEQASAPAIPAGATIGTYSGTGTQHTQSFNAPASGNFIVYWTYSGNTDPSIGGGTNFNISDTDGSASGNLPNDIATSGSGSTEMTGASGVESFNVQATGHWIIKVVSAP